MTVLAIELDRSRFEVGDTVRGQVLVQIYR